MGRVNAIHHDEQLVHVGCVEHSVHDAQMSNATQSDEQQVVQQVVQHI